jgi:hypothetical protein
MYFYCVLAVLRIRKFVSLSGSSIAYRSWFLSRPISSVAHPFQSRSATLRSKIILPVDGFGHLMSKFQVDA